MEELEIPLDNVDFDSLTLSSFMLIILIHIDKVRIEKGVTQSLKGTWLEEVVHCIREMRQNKYRISFKFDALMNRVMEERPWFIIGCRLIL